MAENYERTNARQWDGSLQGDSNTRAGRGHELEAHEQILRYRPRPCVILPQRQRPRQPHGLRQRDDRAGNGGKYQSVLPKAASRGRVAGLSDADEKCSTMPNVKSGTPKLRVEGQQIFENRVKCAQYRQQPPHLSEFESIGTFHWPSKEYSPDEILGSYSEALDPIRMSTDCYIVWSPTTSAFQVFGTRISVQGALVKLRLTCFQIASRNIEPVRIYKSHWRTAQPCLYVHLDEEYQNPQILVPAGDATESRQSSKTPRGEGNMTEPSDLEAAKTRETHSIATVNMKLVDQLSKIHYLRGHIQFRIRLGTFVLTSQYRLDVGAMWELSEYEEMTSMPEFRGRVTEELGDRVAEGRALARLQSAEGLLVPHDNTLSRLSEVEPVYSVDFVFRQVVGVLQLTMAWAQIRDGAGVGFHPVPIKTTWVRLDRDTGKATDLVDMNLVDLHTGSAWNFDIKTSQAMGTLRVPEALTRFSERVSISINQTDGHPFVTWRPGVSPVSVKESTIYLYRINKSDYTLELSHFQTQNIDSDQLPAGDTAVEMYEKRWSVNVYRTEWDNEFAKNERLKISEKAEWDGTSAEWFPADDSYEGGGDGFKQLLQKLKDVEYLIRANP